MASYSFRDLTVRSHKGAHVRTVDPYMYIAEVDFKELSERYGKTFAVDDVITLAEFPGHTVLVYPQVLILRAAETGSISITVRSSQSGQISASVDNLTPTAFPHPLTVSGSSVPSATAGDTVTLTLDAAPGNARVRVGFAVMDGSEV